MKRVKIHGWEVAPWHYKDVKTLKVLKEHEHNLFHNLGEELKKEAFKLLWQAIKDVTSSVLKSTS